MFFVSVTVSSKALNITINLDWDLLSRLYVRIRFESSEYLRRKSSYGGLASLLCQVNPQEWLSCIIVGGRQPWCKRRRNRRQSREACLE